MDKQLEGSDLLPVYLITKDGKFLVDGHTPGASPAFGTEPEALAYAGKLAAEQGIPVEKFVVVCYTRPLQIPVKE